MKRSILFFFQLSFIFFSNTSLNGQTLLQGSVHDQNEASLQGVVVGVDGNIILKSDAEELFIINSLNKGQHILSVKYKKSEQIGEIFAEGKERTIEFI